MKKRYVSIWLPHLVTDWFCLQQPHLCNVAFAVRVKVHGRMILSAVNALAESKGIYTGMSLADARALHPELEVVDEREGLHTHLLQRMAEWCIRFTPTAAIDTPAGIVLDASGCAHLWGGELQYVNHITERLAAKGYQAIVSMADTLGAAWAVARFGRMPVVPAALQAEALQPLPVACLRLESETINKLYKLGLHTVQHLLQLTGTSLRRRFGTHLLQRLKQALGSEAEMIDAVVVPEPYHERLPCLEPIQTLPGIQLALEQLLNGLCQRLRKEGKGLRVASLKCYRLDGKIETVDITTIAPSVHETHLFKLFELRLGEIEPDLGIELFILEAKKVEDYTPAQEKLWSNSGSISFTGLSELLDRISLRIGLEAVNRYLPEEHHWPERSFSSTKSLRTQPTATWKVERPRPLYFFPRPESIEVTAPVPDYPPMLFRYKGKLHKIVKADGPERIEQEWWLQEGKHRDYYTVEDEEGQRYWIFRSGHYDAERSYGWYLHGIFS